jgi:PAS domain S-box-containing protein
MSLPARKASPALRGSQAEGAAELARYTDLFDFAPVGYFDLGADGTIRLANLTGARMIGIERGRLINRRFGQFVAIQQRAQFAEFIERVFSSGVKEAFDVALETAPGRPACFFHLEAVLAPEGEACRVVLLDITEQTKAGQSLRESERFNRSILDALHALVVVLDDKGTILASNIAWRGFSEQNSGDWQLVSEGRNYLTVCEHSAAAGCADAEHTIKGIRDVISGALASWTYEYPCHAPGEQRWYVCRVSRMLGEGPVRVVVAHENITAIKRAREAQHTVSDRLRLAVQAANLGLWDWDMLTNRVEFSAEWKAQLGHAENEIGNDFKEWEDRLHPEDRVEAIAHLRRYLARPLGPHIAEFRLRHKDGSWRWIYTRAEIFRDANGHPIRMVGCHLDVTEQRLLTEQVLRNQRMEAIGTLAGGVAHDLNNILAPILLVTEMIRRKTDDPEILRLVEMIDAGTKRGAHIIRQVLVFSRGTRGQRKTLRLVELMAELEGFIRETFPREITLNLKVGRGLKPILADATQIHQVIMNLCLNARDAMLPKGGVLTLNARNVEVTPEDAQPYPQAKPGPHIVIEVSDTGHGMDAKTAERIFDPFFTTKDVGMGSGLGLSSALGIVRSHQGFITVASKPDEGATFRVFIPADETAQAPLADAPRKTAYTQGKGERVLVVDDEDMLRDTTKLILESNGYVVITAADGRQALNLFKQEAGAVKLVLTDIMMPEMNGIELIKELRVKAPMLPIVVSSGHMQEKQRETLAALGVTTILTKPFGAEKLLNALHAVLSPPAAN